MRLNPLRALSEARDRRVTEEVTEKFEELMEGSGVDRLLTMTDMGLGHDPDIGAKGEGEGPDLAERDFEPGVLTEIQHKSWVAFQTNPLAHSQITALVSLVYGRGFDLVSDNLDVQRILSEFKDKRDQNWRTSIIEWANRFYLDGEVFFLMHVDTVDGDLLVRDIESSEITGVVFHPGDNKFPLLYKRVYKKRIAYEAQSNVSEGKDPTPGHTNLALEGWTTEEKIEYIPSVELFFRGGVDLDALKKALEDARVVISDELLQTNNVNKVGKVNRFMYHWRIPTISTHIRAFPWLQPRLRWILNHDRLLRWIIDIYKSSTLWVWLFKVSWDWWKDLTPVEKKAFQTPPKPGSIKVVDKESEFSPTSAGGQLGATGDVREFKLMATAGSGLPEYIVTGDASNANYASTKISSKQIELFSWFHRELAKQFYCDRVGGVLLRANQMAKKLDIFFVEISVLDSVTEKEIKQIVVGGTGLEETLKDTLKAKNLGGASDLLQKITGMSQGDFQVSWEEYAQARSDFRTELDLLTASNLVSGEGYNLVFQQVELSRLTDAKFPQIPDLDDKSKDAQFIKVKSEMGVSKQTLLEELGYNPAQERVRKEAEGRAQGAEAELTPQQEDEVGQMARSVTEEVFPPED